MVQNAMKLQYARSRKPNKGQEHMAGHNVSSAATREQRDIDQ